MSFCKEIIRIQVKVFGLQSCIHPSAHTTFLPQQALYTRKPFQSPGEYSRATGSIQHTRSMHCLISARPSRDSKCPSTSLPVGLNRFSILPFAQMGYYQVIGRIDDYKFVVNNGLWQEFIDETERPKNQVMRAIETLSEAYIWENFWHIFAPVYFQLICRKRGTTLL